MGRRDLVDLDIVLIWRALVGLLALIKLHEGGPECVATAAGAGSGMSKRSEVGNQGKTVRYQQRMER